jgi:formylglycine-generating enzyme required for sulfatase activity
MVICIVLVVLSVFPLQQTYLAREAGGAELGKTFSVPVDAEHQIDNDGNVSWFYYGERGAYNVKVTKEFIVTEIEQYILNLSQKDAGKIRSNVRDAFWDYLVDKSDNGRDFRDEYTDGYTRWVVQYGNESIGDDVMLVTITDAPDAALRARSKVSESPLAAFFELYGDGFPDGLAGINLEQDFVPSDQWVLKYDNNGWKIYDGEYANKDIFRIFTDESSKIVRLEYIYYSLPSDFKHKIREYLLNKYKKYLIEDIGGSPDDIVTQVLFRDIDPKARTASLLLSCEYEKVKLVSIIFGHATKAAAEVTTTKPKYYTNSIGMKLRLVEPGSYQMGTRRSYSGHPYEKPIHTVRISKPFYIGVYEVTQAEYEKIMDSRDVSSFGKYEKLPEKTGPNYPASMVTWYDANEFCMKLSLREGVRYRLPTEAEWEYACRAGTTTQYYWGDQYDEAKARDHAWFRMNANKIYWSAPHANHPGAQPVGLKKANTWGLYDMAGNLSEWCSDRFKPDYYTFSPEVDPPGSPTGGSRITRSGRWDDSDVKDLRCSYRAKAPPNYRSNSLGLRIVREVE